MTKRQCFYSFHYKQDGWRAGQVRNMGVLDGNRPASDNDWETVKRGGEAAIKRWIDSQLKYRSCTVVLVGSETAGRRWINYEIVKSWDAGMGVVGIYVHGLQDRYGNISAMGNNPFANITHGVSGRPLSNIVKCYNPSGQNSRQRYDWISRYLSDAVEEAISIRGRN